MSLLDPTGILTGIAVEAVVRGADGLWKFRRRRPDDAASRREEDTFPRPMPGLPPRCALPEDAEKMLSGCLGNAAVKVILLDGPLGSGKRTLATSVVTRAAEARLGGIRAARVALVDLSLEVWPDDLRTILASLDESGTLAPGWDKATALEQRLRLVARTPFTQPTLLWLMHVEALQQAGDEVWEAAIPALLTELDAYDNNLRVLLTSRAVPEGLRALAPGTCERIRLPAGLPSPQREALLDALAAGCPPLQDMTPSEKADFLERTRGNPMLMGRIANALRLDDGETDWRDLVTGDVAGDVRALWESAYRRLSARQRDVIAALAVLAMPASAASAADLLDIADGESNLRAAITHLQRDDMLEQAVSADGVPLFSLHVSDRAMALQSLDPTRRSALHDAAARHFAGRLAQYTEEARGSTSYSRFYRFEDPRWQGNLTEWLWHQARSPGDRGGHLELAHIFFGAFWWWDEFIEFPFVDSLLKRWRETQPDPADQRFAGLLESFRSAYPRGTDANRAGRAAWNAALTSLTDAREALGLPGHRDDVAAAAVEALSAFYLAEAHQFRPVDGQAAREADRAEALRLYNVAQAGFEALTDQAVEDHPLGVAYDWAVPYALARKATLLGDMGNEQAAICALAEGITRLRSACGSSMEIADDDCEEDFEAATWLYRAAGDLLWSRGRRAEAWAAYRLLGWNAFLFQGIPPPTDDYSVAVYSETVRHLASRVDEASAEESMSQVAAFRAFWLPWRETVGGEWPEGSGAAVHSPSAFMPAPEAVDGSEFLDTALRLLNSSAASDAVRREEAILPSLFGAERPADAGCTDDKRKG